MAISTGRVIIDHLKRDFSSGVLKLPPFQRRFVWTQEQIIELLDSIYKGYPIGCIITWRARVDLPARRDIGGFLLPHQPQQFPVDYILDGQQRLTALYAVFCSDRTINPDTDAQYVVDPTIFDISFDFNDNLFVKASEVDTGHDNLPLSILFQADQFSRVVDNFSTAHRPLAQQLYRKFADYEIPFVYADTEQDNIGVIFERINNTATNLSPLNLMVAWTWNGDFHLKEELDSILTDLGDKGFDEISEKILLQCIGSIVGKTAKTRQILALEAEEVRANIENLRDGLEKTADFLSTELNMLSIDFLPHSHQIVPLAYFFASLGTPLRINQNRILRKWFWRTSFSLRYADSTDEKINEDILFMDAILSGTVTKAQMDKYSISVDEDIIEKQKFSKANPFTRAFLLLLAQRKPKDMATGRNIDIGIALSNYNLKEYHHIFPCKFLKSRGIEAHEISSLCNFTFLPADSNKLISCKAPSKYFFEKKLAVAGHGKRSVFTSNLLPDSLKIYKDDDYVRFLHERAGLIMDMINNLI